MVNKVILIGNLGKDPEVRRLEDGRAVARLTLATNESYTDRMGQRQKLTEWHNIVFWRRLAEVAETYLKKGSKIYVEGKLTTRKWQDQNGNDRYTTEIVGQSFQMLDSRGDDNQSPGQNISGGQVNTPKPTNEAEKTDDFSPGSGGDADDLPF